MTRGIALATIIKVKYKNNIVTREVIARELEALVVQELRSGRSYTQAGATLRQG
jgi:hypothetical protein